LDRHIVLLMGGGLGIGPLARLMRALDGVELPIAAVVIAGRNKRMERRVLAAAEGVGYPVRAMRFVDNVYDYMHAADVLVTKPGGLTAAEALVAQLPMVLCKPLPGQEERNARILCEAGAAVRSRTVGDLAETVSAVLAPGARRERMLVAARRIARPHAAAEAASLIARLVRMRKEVVA
jgi:processive 1,2-diacylglycerol beta-glucosyltransferase